jgi:hypothetical protein
MDHRSNGERVDAVALPYGTLLRPSPRVGPCSLAGGRTHDRGCGQETNDDLKLPGTDSQAATNLLSDKFPEQANGSVPIAFRAPAGAKLSDTRYEKPIEQVTRAYGKDSAATHAVGSFSEQGADQLNKTRPRRPTPARTLRGRENPCFRHQDFSALP